jgi:hypothetical protein
MAQIIFNDYQAFNNAKDLPLTTIVIGEPIYEKTEEGHLTGRFIIDHFFTPEQLEELATHNLVPVQEE